MQKPTEKPGYLSSILLNRVFSMMHSCSAASNDPHSNTTSNGLVGCVGVHVCMRVSAMVFQSESHRTPTKFGSACISFNTGLGSSFAFFCMEYNLQ